MIQDETLKQLIQDRGFTILNYSYQGPIEERQLDRIGCMSKEGIALMVYPKTNEWELQFVLPYSIFTFNCPKCGSFDDDEHFNKFYKKFKKEVIECWGI